MKKMFYGSAPVLFVRDLKRSLNYYCDILGFKRPQLWGDPPSFAMPSREDMILMLSRQDDESKIQPKQDIWDIYFWVKDVQALFDSFKEKGAIIQQTPVFKELYGNLEFIIKDPDGYTLAFGQEIAEANLEKHKQTPPEDETKMLFMSPVLASENVARDIEWYEQKLGFKNVYDSTAYSDNPVDYAVLGRQDLYLHLQFQFPQDMTSTDIRFQVKNIQPIFQEYLAKDLFKEDALWETAWGTREFGFFDLSGNRLTFFEDL